MSSSENLAKLLDRIFNECQTGVHQVSPEMLEWISFARQSWKAHEQALVRKIKAAVQAGDVVGLVGILIDCDKSLEQFEQDLKSAHPLKGVFQTAQT